MAACSCMNTNPDYTGKFLLAGGVKLRDPHNTQAARLRSLTRQANLEELEKELTDECPALCVKHCA